MDPTELQKAKEAFDSQSLEGQVKDIEITTELEDKFIRSLESGTSFSMVFNIHKTFSIKVRDKTVKEAEIIIRAVDKMCLRNKEVSWTEYSRMYNLFSLYYQIDEINGVVINKEYPSSMYGDFDLAKLIEETSPIPNWPLAIQYAALSSMCRFNNVAKKLAMKSIEDPSFF